MQNHTQDVVDRVVGSVPATEAGQPRDTGSPSPGRPSSASDAVEAQLQRVEDRLIALAGGDPALERDVRRHLMECSARFSTARVRQFVPILVEREVRARLRAGQLNAEDRTA
jgi:hypothetical protein